MTQGCSRFANARVGFLQVNQNVRETLINRLLIAVRDTACGISHMGVPIAVTGLKIRRGNDELNTITERQYKQNDC